MRTDAQSLYELLPAIYRIKDAELGGPLQALVGVLAGQASVVEQDIERLHRNWFIETCDDWVVAYIGELLGVRALHPVSTATFSLRARVANTMSYRRRKGTAAMLEQLARDSTGWPARAVEFFQLLSTTQNYNHLRLGNLATPDLRRTDVLELLDTPFDTITHSADVRHIASRCGKHNIPNVGLFLWRLSAYPLEGVTARALADPPDGRFTFSPVGNDAPLFNSPTPEIEVSHLAEEINVPAPLRRRALYDELEARRRSIAASEEPVAQYFDDDPVLRVFVGEEAGPLKPEEIMVCDLSDWHLPPKKKTYELADGSSVDLPIRAAIDPKLGRITFSAGARVRAAYVDYAYGFSGDLGGGPYDRSESLRALKTLDGERSLLQSATWRVGVSQTIPSVANEIFGTLAEAVHAWNLQPAGTIGTIAVLDSRTYTENLSGASRIQIPEGSQLLIYAADLAEKQPIATAIPKERRPHLDGDVSVVGAASADSDVQGELIIDGLLIEGDVTVLKGQLGSLRLQHCTVVPTKGELDVHDDNDELIVRLLRSICGQVTLPSTVTQIYITDCIIDGDGSASVDATGARADIEGSTFFGTVDVQVLEASDSIFTDTLNATRHQVGCVRSCWLPELSSTPRRYRCQPELALLATSDPAEQKRISARLRPMFTSDVYGQPAYARLAVNAPVEIRTGADDGSEMGAFDFLKQPQRETNLEASLDEYLRFGLEAGVFFAT